MSNNYYICAFCGHEKNTTEDIEGEDCTFCTDGYYLNTTDDDNDDEN